MKHPAGIRIGKILALLLLIPGLYVLSILWRVSLAEQQAFGRSDLLPLSWNRPKYSISNGLHIADAHGSGTFLFNRDGEKVIVWRQKVNGFQHIYGSALAAYELGDKPAGLLFCGNEYMEAYADLIFDLDGIEQSDLRDRRKDLRHNAIGRKIGLDAKTNGLRGVEADHYIRQRILALVDQGGGYIPHYNSPLVDQLKSESDMGCPGLPPPFSLYAFADR
ncbi:MAG TPA: hypothetical protein V6C52_07480 [Coleofasciculaceae cyanobacterium]